MVQHGKQATRSQRNAIKGVVPGKVANLPRVGGGFAAPCGEETPGQRCALHPAALARATVPATRKQPAPPASPVSADCSRDAQRLIIRIPASAFTLAGFREWALKNQFREQARVASIGGKIYIDLSNQGAETHGGVKREVCGVLIPLGRSERLRKFYPSAAAPAACCRRRPAACWRPSCSRAADPSPDQGRRCRPCR